MIARPGRRFGEMSLPLEFLLLVAGFLAAIMVDYLAVSLGLSSRNPTGTILVVMVLGRIAILGLAVCIRSIGLITGMAVWSVVVFGVWNSLSHHGL